VPIVVNGTTYHLSFHEREKKTTFLNLIPLAVDTKLESEGKATLMDEYHTSRTGHWYLVLTVYNDDLQDCLNPDYQERGAIIAHLRKLQNEYIRTSNYLEAYFNHQN
jgi:hypothetical protein